MKIIQKPVNKYFIYFLPFIFLMGCSPETVTKTEGEISKYIIYGYLSSKKDRISFDLTIKVDSLSRSCQVKGFDTLLGKERFLVYLKNGEWFIKDYENKEEGKLRSDAPFLDTLPPLNYFDYLDFFEGKTPILKDSIKKISNDKIIYQKDNFIQELSLSKDGKTEKITFYHQNKKIYQFEYQSYIIKGKRIFPKSMVIIDYENKKKIAWWLNKIQTGDF